jgi:hypothetical protein
MLMCLVLAPVEDASSGLVSVTVTEEGSLLLHFRKEELGPVQQLCSFAERSVFVGDHKIL